MLDLLDNSTTDADICLQSLDLKILYITGSRVSGVCVDTAIVMVLRPLWNEMKPCYVWRGYTFYNDTSNQ